MDIKRYGIFFMLLGSLGLGTATGAPLQPSRGAVVTHAVTLSSGDVIAGPLALDHPLHVVIALKLRNQAQLQALISKPGGYTPLTPAQFAAQFSPTSTQAQQVANFLINAGFNNVNIAPDRLLVSGDATTAMVQTAFNTTMVRVQTHDGREAFANTSDAIIPAALQDMVQSVLGLQTVNVAHTTNIHPQHGEQPEMQADAISGHDPTEFAAIYSTGALPTASSISVGIIVEGSMTNVLNDLNTFTTNNSLPPVITRVVGNGGSDTSADDEWDLDSQSIIGMSGGVQKLIFYATTSLSSANLTADYNAAVAADTAKVINVSIGGCERYFDSGQGGDGSAQADDQIFEEASAQGQTFSVSSGDTGANECAPAYSSGAQYPASSPYVVAVGGTKLDTLGTTWNSETVWNDPAPPPPPPPCTPPPPCPSPQYAAGATGGSPSSFEPMPSWQQGIGQNVGHSTRGVPDVAFDASESSGALIIFHGQTQQFGGTSLASPLFVGAWARILAFKAGPIPWAAPLLYGLKARDFHDVTIGNNNGETAAPGWDYTTGFGSLIVNQAAYDLPVQQGPPDSPPVPPG